MERQFRRCVALRYQRIANSKVKENKGGVPCYFSSLANDD